MRRLKIDSKTFKIFSVIKVAVVTKSANNAVWWYRVLPWFFTSVGKTATSTQVIHHQNLQTFEAMIGGLMLVIHSPSNQRDYQAQFKSPRIRCKRPSRLRRPDKRRSGVERCQRGVQSRWGTRNCFEATSLLIITVSTSELANQFETQLGKRPDVINNTHNDFVLGAFPKPTIKPKTG